MLICIGFFFLCLICYDMFLCRLFVLLLSFCGIFYMLCWEYGIWGWIWFMWLKVILFFMDGWRNINLLRLVSCDILLLWLKVKMFVGFLKLLSCWIGWLLLVWGMFVFMIWKVIYIVVINWLLLVILLLFFRIVVISVFWLFRCVEGIKGDYFSEV